MLFRADSIRLPISRKNASPLKKNLSFTTLLFYEKEISFFLKLTRAMMTFTLSLPREFPRTRMMFTRLLTALVLVTGLNSCASLAIQKVTLDTSRDLYIGETKTGVKVTLRQTNQHLIRDRGDAERYVLFFNGLTNSAQQKILDRQQPKAYTSFQIEEIATAYALANRLIARNDGVAAIRLISALLKKFPDLKNETDLHFLKAVVLERQASQEEARTNYQMFLDFSERKFPEILAVTNLLGGDAYLREVSIAKERLTSNAQIGNAANISNLLQYQERMFYVIRGTAGFNHEPRDKPGIIGFDVYIGSRGLGVTMEIFAALNRWLDIGFYPYLGFVGEYGMELSASIQVFRSKDRRVGLQLVPVAKASYYNQSTEPKTQQFLYNIGLRASLGLHIVQPLRLEASYTYFLYNQFFSDKRVATNGVFSFWDDNAYQVGANFEVMPGLGIKGLFRNEDLVGGFESGGFFIGWGFFKKQLLCTFERFL